MQKTRTAMPHADGFELGTTYQPTFEKPIPNQL